MELKEILGSGSVNNKKLCDYLRTVMNLEAEKRTLDIAYNRCVSYANSLGIPENFRDPGGFSFGSWLTEFLRESCIFIFIAMSGTAVVLAIRFLCSDLLNDFLIGWFFKFINVLGWIAMCAGFGLFLFWMVFDFFETKSDDAKKRGEYYQKVSADNQRIQREKELLVTIKEDMALLQKQRSQIRDVLNQYYALNIIYAKYRTLPAISMFVQYLESGRCNSLTGHGGCYDTFEYEVQINRISEKLDVVIQKLDELADAQYELANLLRDSNRKIQRLSDQRNQTTRHLAVIENQNRLQLETTQVLGKYMIYRDLLS